MNGKRILLEICSPESVIFHGNVESITMPGVSGSFQVLYNHAPLITSLGAGEMSWTAEDGGQTLKISSGFVEVGHNVVSVCVEV